LQIAGNLVYVTDGVGIQIIDATNPALPVKIGSLSTGAGAVTAVQVIGARAYLSGLGMSIVDVGDPRRPKLLGRAVPSLVVDDMDVVGNLAYIAADTNGLQIVDVLNPAAPVVKGSYAGKATAIRTIGTTAYVAAESGLTVIDASVPAAPQLRGSYSSLDRSVDVQVAGSSIYLADQDGGLRVLDAADPIRPTLVSAFDGVGSVSKLHVHDGRAYLVAQSLNAGLELDLTTVAPTRLRGIVPGLAQANGIQMVGSLAYVATGQDGLQIIDITTPHYPRRVGGFARYNFGDASSLFSVEEVRVVGNRAYILDSERGLLALDISNPSIPLLLNPTPASTGGGALGASFEVVGTTAYVGSGTGNFYIYDFGNPRQPKLLGSLSVPGGVQDLAVANGFAYVAAGGSGFRIIDVHTPSAPSARGSYATPATAYGIDVAGNLAYVANGPDNGLLILDVSNPNAPSLRGHLPLAGSTQRVEVDGTLAYVGNGATLQVVDITNPAAPTLRATFDTPGYILGALRASPLIYTAAGIAGLYVLWYLPSTTASIGPSGGTLNSGVDHTAYTIPAGAFSAATTFTHTPRYQGSLPAHAPLIGIGHAFEVSATLSASTQPIAPSRAYTITVTYSAAERGPAIAQTLALYAWDGSQWTKLPNSTTNPTTKTVRAATSRLGIFAVLGETRRVYLPLVRR
jgi:hypothetical protein